MNKEDIKLIREVLECEAQSLEDRYHNAVSSTLRRDLTARRVKCEEAKEALSRLSAQQQEEEQPFDESELAALITGHVKCPHCDDGEIGPEPCRFCDGYGSMPPDMDTIRGRVRDLITKLLHPKAPDAHRVINFDSAGLMEGSEERWKQYGYDKAERVEERFRSPLVIWKTAWIESRAALIGRLLPEVKAPDKVLTDEEAERIAAERHPDWTGNGRSATIRMARQLYAEALRYARDNGYLSPAPDPSVERLVKAGDALRNRTEQSTEHLTVAAMNTPDKEYEATMNRVNEMDAMVKAWDAAKSSLPKADQH